MRDLLTLALTSHALEAPSPPVRNELWRRIRTFVETATSAEELVEAIRPRVAPAEMEAVAARLQVLGEAESLRHDFERHGMSLVTEFDPSYPSLWHGRLKGRTPPLLFVAGNIALLNVDSIGVVGSRNVDERGSSFAKAVAAVAVAGDHAVVSGGARGVDLDSMRAALDEGGKTVGFLADSMVNLAKRPQMRAFLDEGRVCLATPYSPSAGFNVGNAMGRNRLIYAHSRATVVVSAEAEKGGTWAGATEALKHDLCPVLVRDDGEVPSGNRRLCAMGGVPLQRPEDLWRNIPEQVPEEPTLF